jgi:TldD protein
MGKSVSHEELTGQFEEISKKFNRKDQYFDILYDSVSSIEINKTKSQETVSINANRSGVVLRTFLGSWKEFALSDLSGLKDAEKKVPRGKNHGADLAEYEGWKVNKEAVPRIDPATVPIEDKIRKIREFYDYIKKSDSRITNPIIQYAENHLTRIFVNNEGCVLKQVIPRTRIFIQPVAKDGAIIDFDYLSVGGEIGYEIMDLVEKEGLDGIIKDSLDLLKAENPPAGRFPVILDPDMAGLIAHESFGHGLEADQILRNRSYLKNFINEKVASDICNISDSPALDSELGSYFFDDEGTRAQKTRLVENGVLKNLLHSRTTASVLKGKPNGNGRRESYAHPLFVRMTNTFFEAGDRSLDEMISGIKHGVLLVKGDFGMEDPLGGGMQCTSRKGYLIENGEKTKLLKAITLSGSVLELLKDIDGVSKDKMNLNGGVCGKGNEDFVPVTSGGSSIRVKKASISSG